MPPKRYASRKSSRVKAASTTPRSPSPDEAHAHPLGVAESPEPAPECGIQEMEREVSPGPSDASASKSEDAEDAEQSQKAKKKKAKTLTHLTMDQQEAMVDWLKAHEVLYNRKLESYKDTKKKGFLWQQQAEVMGVNVDELKIWYTSLRTRFTKLKKKKSGDGAPDHSERDQWVLDNFSFLAPFTYEVKKRTLLKSKLLLPSDTTPDPIDDNDFIPPSGQMASQVSDSQQQAAHSTAAFTTTSRSSTPQPMHSFTSAVSGKMDQFMEMQNRVMQQMVRPNTDRMKEAFIEYIRESVYEIHPALWEDMHRDIMKTVLMYKDRESQLKRAQQRARATVPAEPCGSSSAWQPPPHMWPSTVQNPLSVWGSAERAWVQQQFPHDQRLSQHQQQPQQFFQPQQQTSFSRQDRQQGKQQDISALNISSLTPMASKSLQVHGANTSFSCGISSFLEGVQQQRLQQEAEQEEPPQSQDHRLNISSSDCD
ncbi:uncharacterized protein LOC124123203 [Haliotis rufescens]|uniref:uncharacterized protein LOC124123203 n=1 Tax=Haliotis rufescens TaxID=6454 RepID=UPI00201F64D8|nr:uncharacterized protein LOC124123203 [Haliotis rufescens]